MHKMKPQTNHNWVAYLAASEKAARPKPKPRRRRRKKNEDVIKDMTTICTVWFWSFAGGAAAVIGWLLLFGWR